MINKITPNITFSFGGGWMMNTKYFWLSLGCIFSLFLSSCGSAGGPGPRTWIDAPLDGSTLPLEPVVVRSHAASGSGTTSAALFVNGTQVRVDNVTDSSGQLVEISQVWEPALPGSYEIKVVTFDSSGNQGNSNSVHINIGEVANPAPVEGGQPPETLEPPETSLPVPIETDTPATEAPPSVPSFEFTTNANCREGPSTQYEVDDSFSQGQSVQIDGQNQDQPRWWWVLRSNGDHCWVSDSTGTASGPAGSVQVVVAPAPPVVVVPPADITEPPPTDTTVPPPPPPPPQTAPTAPSNFSVDNKTCNSSTYVVGLSWADSDGEQGYRVYRDGKEIANLSANATSFDDISPNYNAHNYYVTAYNDAGFANGPIKSSAGCLY